MVMGVSSGTVLAFGAAIVSGVVMVGVEVSDE